MKVLYIGSGISALQAKNEEYSDHTIVCLNNAWRIFEDGGEFEVWLHTGDFPRENYPMAANYKKEVSYKDYKETAKQAAEIFSWKTIYPEHYAGYTAFFQGLYWILMRLSPEKIGLLGFDHDYNMDKTEKWLMDGAPNIQNDFNKKSEKTIKEWSDNYFKDFKEDFFYGHGTPDPLRPGLSYKYMEEKMKLAKICAMQLGTTIVNYSKRASPYNVFERE